MPKSPSYFVPDVLQNICLYFCRCMLHSEGNFWIFRVASDGIHDLFGNPWKLLNRTSACNYGIFFSTKKYSFQVILVSFWQARLWTFLFRWPTSYPPPLVAPLFAAWKTITPQSSRWSRIFSPSTSRHFFLKFHLIDCSPSKWETLISCDCWSWNRTLVYFSWNVP
jgi:hypothetical protein